MTEQESYLKTLTRFGIKLGLERIKAMLSLAGEPQTKFPSVLIGGTNGKGSTAAFLSSILQAAGYRVGTFTSPHLVSYRERMTINEKLIEPDEFEDLLEQSKAIAAKVAQNQEFGEPTEFEVLTLMGFCYFAQKQVDIAVVEVGLGGRFDATNTLQPLVSIVTNISFDHTDRLGKTLLEIAREKFGIARPNVPFATAERKPVVLHFFEHGCAELGAPLIQVGKDVTWRKISGEACGLTASFKTWRSEYLELRTKMPGDFQLANLGCALAAVECLRDLGFRISDFSVQEGAAKACCRGRVEVIQKNPTVVCDGAHNQAGAQALSRVLRSVFRYRRLILVIGVMADKDVPAILNHLAPIADEIVATNADTPRALPAHRLAEFCSSFGKPVQAITPVPAAFQAAMERVSEEDLICLTGSLYVLGELDFYQQMTNDQ